MTNSLRILLLEDSETDVALILHELRRSGMAVTTKSVESEEQFAEAIRTVSPHVVICGNSLADFDACAALAVIRTQSPGTPLLVVTAAIDGAKSVACVRAGAEDLILKQNIGRLAGAISDAIAVRKPLRALTPRQLEVLQLIAEGWRTREIAARLSLSAKTVESHRGEIMKRLGIHELVGLVRYAVRVGLVALGPNGRTGLSPAVHKESRSSLIA
jgi:DNA-binding NarL/FixJ family response regulator